MDTQSNPYITLPGISAEELAFLPQATANLDDEQKKRFFYIYRDKRKSPQDMLLFILIGFLGVAGVHKFVMGETVMGVLYLFTWGFCGVCTLDDAIKHKKIALEYNKKMAYESYQMAQTNQYAFY